MKVICMSDINFEIISFFMTEKMKIRIYVVRINYLKVFKNLKAIIFLHWIKIFCNNESNKWLLILANTLDKKRLIPSIFFLFFNH